MDREDIRMSELHTLVKCAHCERGVRNEYSVDGMCPSCAEAELERLRGIEAAVCTMSGSRPRGLSQLLRGWAANIVSADGICVRSAWLNAIADAWEAK